MNLRKFNEDITTMVTGAASILMTMIASRGVIIWLINLVLLIVVLRIALRAHRDEADEADSETGPRSRRHSTYNASDRIRSWYSFYGGTMGRANTNSAIIEDLGPTYNGDRTTDFEYIEIKPKKHSRKTVRLKTNSNDIDLQNEPERAKKTRRGSVIRNIPRQNEMSESAEQSREIRMTELSKENVNKGSVKLKEGSGKQKNFYFIYKMMGT